MINSIAGDSIILYFLNKIDKEAEDSKDLQIADPSTFKNFGYFLVKTMFNLIKKIRTLNIVVSNYNCHYDFLTYSRLLVMIKVLV